MFRYLKKIFTNNNNKFSIIFLVHIYVCFLINIISEMSQKVNFNMEKITFLKNKCTIHRYLTCIIKILKISNNVNYIFNNIVKRLHDSIINLYQTLSDCKKTYLFFLQFYGLINIYKRH